MGARDTGPVEVTGHVREVVSGHGLGGVAVSNGEAIVVTDADGRYRLSIEPAVHRFVFLTVPDAFHPEGIFYLPTDGTRSHDGFDFALAPAPERSGAEFTLAHITDTHVVAKDDGRLGSREKLTEDLRTLVAHAQPDFIIASGDQTNIGAVAELEAYTGALAGIATPVFTLFAGHDGNAERFAAWEAGRSGETYTRNFERILGPTYYSFDWGGWHFVLYQNEDFFYSEVEQAHKASWLAADLALQPADKPIAIVLHEPPARELLEQFARHGARLLLHGHWHSSKVFSYGEMAVASVPSLSFGAIDTIPRGYRLFRFDNGRFEMALKTLPTLAAPVATTVPGLQEGSEDLVEKWRALLPKGLHRAAPVVFEDMILVGLGDEENDGRAGVYGIDAATGAIRWHCQTDASVKNSVAVGDAPNACCTAVSITGSVFLIDPATGGLIWSKDLPGHPLRWLYTSPVVADGVVYAGGKSGYGAYDCATANELWYTELEWRDDWSCYASPMVYEELLIVFESRRGLLALDRATGTIVWENKLAVDYQWASPILVDGTIVTGGDPGQLVGLDAVTGKLLWTRSLDAAPYPTGIASAGNRLFVGTGSGEVLCFDDGDDAPLWRFRVTDDLLDMTPYARGIRSVLARPVPFGDLVVAPACDGRVYLLKQSTGRVHACVSFDGPVSAPVCATPDGFIVGTYRGELRAYVFRDKGMPQ